MREMRRRATDSSMCNPLNSICRAELAGSIHTLMSRFCVKWSRKDQKKKNPVKKKKSPLCTWCWIEGFLQSGTKQYEEMRPFFMLVVTEKDKSLRVWSHHAGLFLSQLSSISSLISFRKRWEYVSWTWASLNRTSTNASPNQLSL